MKVKDTISVTPYRDLIAQLNRNADGYLDPVSQVRWELLDEHPFWLPERAISVYGTPAYTHLSGHERARLSRWEFLHYTSIGLRVEAVFMKQLARMTNTTKLNVERRIHALHQLREDSGHSLMFYELQKRSGLYIELPGSPWLNFQWLITLNAALHSAAVFIGESVPDAFNRYLSRYRRQINPVIADIVQAHMHDEAKHLASSRAMTTAQLTTVRGLPKSLIISFATTIATHYIRWLFYPPAHIYTSAGLEHGVQWRELALRNQQRRQFIAECLANRLSVLRQHGFKLPFIDS